MSEDRKELLKEYIKANIVPILIEGVSGKTFPNSVTLPANIDKSLLNGHYENDKFIPPSWYSELINSKKSILVIDGLDSIDKDEQMKFGEILKYRKVSTFNLPKNVVILVTASKVNKKAINEEIISLVCEV